MSEGTRIAHTVAAELAAQFVTLIKPACLRVEVAGSLRRGAETVGDIEIVAQVAHQKDDALDALIDQLEGNGIFTPKLRASDNKPEAWGGERQKRGVFQNTRLDLFIVRPDRDWGVTFLIRTGGGDANKYLVTRAVDGDHGACPAHIMFYEGALYRLPYYADWKLEKPPVGAVKLSTPEEHDVFEAVGFPYVAPQDRSVARYREIATHRINNPLHTIPASHKITVCTSRINCADVEALDITIGAIEAGRITEQGAALAPTRDMVRMIKDKVITEAEYTERYLALLCWRYTQYGQVFIDLLARDRVVLTCYCPPLDKDGHQCFCHRHIAVDVLEKIATKHGVEFVRGGEIEVATKAQAEQIAADGEQLALFAFPEMPAKRFNYE